MKVLHIINIGGFGGAEKLLLQLLPEMNKMLPVTCLVCCNKENDESAKKIGEELTAKGVPVHYRYYSRIVSRKLLKDILQVIGAGKYDLVHSHLKYANLWMAWLKWRKKITIPVITTLHGYRDSYQNKHGLIYKKGAFFSLYYHTTNMIFKQLDGFIVISRCLKEFFERSRLLKAKEMQVIYHGYEIPANTGSSHLRTGPLRDPIIAIPGRLIKLKGHSYAIEVVKELLRSNRNATLHIYGSGPEEENIRGAVRQNGLEKNIIFHGYVHDLLHRLGQCDIVLIPSMYESFGLVFLDAFAAGVPVVAFDLPAGNEIITDHYNGLLAKPYNHRSLYEQVDKLCESEDLRRTLVANASSKLKTSFSIARMADDYVQYYNYLCKAE